MVRKLSNEKRDKFLQAALKLFVLNGVQHTSTAEIAREAGTAAGTLFLYFPTKQDLINELVIAISKEHSAAIRGALDPALSARDTFFAIWSGIIRWFLANMEAYRYIQQIRDSAWVPEAVVQESAKDLMYFFEAIQKGYAEGCIKPYSLDLIGGFIYQDIVATLNYIRLLPDPDTHEEAIQQGFEIFWDGIKLN